MDGETSPLPGPAIRRARERRRWTQAQLAEAVGVNVKTVGNWERGHTIPRNRIGAIEEVLGVSLSDHQPEPDPAETALRATGRFTEAEIAAMVAAKRALQPPAPPPNPGHELAPAT